MDTPSALSQSVPPQGLPVLGPVSLFTSGSQPARATGSAWTRALSSADMCLRRCTAQLTTWRGLQGPFSRGVCGAPRNQVPPRQVLLTPRIWRLCLCSVPPGCSGRLYSAPSDRKVSASALQWPPHGQHDTPTCHCRCAPKGGSSCSTISYTPVQILPAGNPC